MVSPTIAMASLLLAAVSASSFRPPFSRIYGGSAEDDANWRCASCERWFVIPELARQCEAAHEADEDPGLRRRSSGLVLTQQ